MKPRKNRSKFASEKYDYLYRYPDRPGWYYKRWSPEKRDTFVFSTGTENEAKAYNLGREAFDEWQGVLVSANGSRLIRDFSRAVLASKESKKGGKFGDTYRSVALQVRHVNTAFGHLKPDQITPLRWDLYDSEERKRVYHRKGKLDPKTGKRELVPYSRTTTNHTRQVLIEILRRAHDEGMIRQVPKLANHDPKPEPPRVIAKRDILKIIRAAGRAGRRTKLLAFIMWKQGARPGEILQYRWDMLRWDEGPQGSIQIPGAITKNGETRTIPLNSKVSRLLKFLEARSSGPYLFPSPTRADAAQGDYKTGWLSACRRAGLEYQIYNLRDTMITNALKRELSSTFIARYVQNSPAMIDAKYAVAEQESLGKVAE